MAKIDTSKIEGYDKMTPEQKIAALEGFDHPDPDYSGYVKKDTFDATASELAALKKKNKEQLSEEERKSQEAAEKQGEDAQEAFPGFLMWSGIGAVVLAAAGLLTGMAVKRKKRRITRVPKL